MKGIPFNDEMVRAILEGRKTQTRRPFKLQPIGPFPYAGTTKEDVVKKCPFGQIGDKLYVKEAFSFDEFKRIVFRADGYKLEPLVWWSGPNLMTKSLHRIILEITEIRVERLREISPQDAVSEDLSQISGKMMRVQKFGLPSWEEHEFRMSPIDAFEKVWNSIYEKKGLGWEENPWVWVIEFKRVEGK